MRRVGAVEVINYGMDHDSLLVDGDGGVGGDGDPVICLALMLFHVYGKTKYTPRSKVNGSLATRTMSEPLSRRSMT